MNEGLRKGDAAGMLEFTNELLAVDSKLSRDLVSLSVESVVVEIYFFVQLAA